MTANPVALVSGSTSGIGAEIARHLHKVGMRVVVTGRSTARGSALASDLGDGSAFCPSDLTESGAASALVEWTLSEFGRLDVLVNNAAVDHSGPLLEVPQEEVRSTIETNLVSAIDLLQAAGRAMVAGKRGGSIINITSRLASAGVPTLGIYSAAKGGLLSLTRTAAVELAPHMIRVNAVAPGLTRTPLYEEWIAGLPDGAAVEAAAVARIPLGRIAEPSDVAAVVGFLASPAAAYITGVSIPVDGGFLAT